MSSIHDVANMHDKKGFKPHRLSKPGFLKDDFMKMRLNFIMEELQELASACGYKWIVDFEKERIEFIKNKPSNLEDALDSLIDIVYVTLGTADLMGFKAPVVPNAKTQFQTSIWWAAWTRVHEANMKKEMVRHTSESSRGFGIDLKKPKGWIKPTFKDLYE